MTDKVEVLDTVRAEAISARVISLMEESSFTSEEIEFVIERLRKYRMAVAHNIILET